MDRATISADLDKAISKGLMHKDYCKHHFRLTKEYVYIYAIIDCEPYNWSGTVLCSMRNHFTAHLRIPTTEYSYRRLSSELRKARKEHDSKWINSAE